MCVKIILPYFKATVFLTTQQKPFPGSDFCYKINSRDTFIVPKRRYYENQDTQQIRTLLCKQI